MARQARGISNTGYYHVIMRGNNKDYIFNNSKDKAYYMEVLLKLQEEGLINLAAWCLMDNHVHLAIKADSDNMTTAMKRLNVKYAMMYHREHQTVGHVFQDRFKSEPIESDEYLMMVIRYIHQNPVKSKKVNKLEAYKWSSYNNYVKGHMNESMTYVMGLFYNSISAFQEFHQQEDEREYLEIKEDQIKFKEEKAHRIITKHCNKKGILYDKEIKKNREMMKEIISDLVENSGLSLRSIAKMTNISYSTVQSYKGNKPLTDQKEPSPMVYPMVINGSADFKTNK